MPKLQGSFKTLIMLGALTLMMMSNSGCRLAFGFLDNAFIFSRFWRTTPLIPVTPYMSQQIEDTYWEEERYGRVPILDPVEGEHAPLIPIHGTPPDLINPPPGCPFEPRCPHAMRICRTGMPRMTQVSDTHRLRCYLMDEGAPKVAWEGGRA